MLSIVIATHNRLEYLKTCLDSVLSQNFKNFEVIVAHSGYSDGTESLINLYPVNFKYLHCVSKGAASQRNEGVLISNGAWIIFIDDDVILEDDFLMEINLSIKRNPQVKGISGRITNQFFEPPGKLIQLLLKFCCVGKSTRLDGRVVGPALNFLPKERGPAEEYIEWMPTCVSAYHRETILRLGIFPEQFQGYSYGEDLYLSLLLSKSHKILLNRNAQLYHNDLGSSSHKDGFDIAKMQVDNRNFINIKILKINKVRFNFHLFLWNSANLFSRLIHRNVNVKDFGRYFIGYLVGFVKNILT